MRNVASRVAIMYLGKICEIAETADFFQHPAAPLHADAALLDPGGFRVGGAVQAQAIISTGEIPSPVNIPTGCSFHTRCPFKMKICTRGGSGDGRDRARTLGALPLILGE